jgi:deoxycytidylate deaminase
MDPALEQTELFIALVAAVGTDIDMVISELETELREYEYSATTLRLSAFLPELIETDFRGKHFDEELWGAMSAGDELRERWDRGDALALAAISDIVATRAEESQWEVEGAPGEVDPVGLRRRAFIFRSLKTRDELLTLRAVYGERVVVIGAYSPKSRRLSHLAERIRDSRRENDPTKWTYSPEQLIDRDHKEEGSKGQDVSGTFHRSDFFIRASDRLELRKDVCRTLEILFGHPYRTPSRDEYGQFQAAGAALRSAELGRQVGAAIVSGEGSVLALGTNEVPKAGGGVYWENPMRASFSSTGWKRTLSISDESLASCGRLFSIAWRGLWGPPVSRLEKS